MILLNGRWDLSFAYSSFSRALLVTESNCSSSISSP